MNRQSIGPGFKPSTHRSAAFSKRLVATASPQQLHRRSCILNPQPHAEIDDDPIGRDPPLGPTGEHLAEPDQRPLIGYGILCGPLENRARLLGGGRNVIDDDALRTVQQLSLIHI